LSDLNYELAILQYDCREAAYLNLLIVADIWNGERCVLAARFIASAANAWLEFSLYHFTIGRVSFDGRHERTAADP
jgi:hypothetical protein